MADMKAMKAAKAMKAMKAMQATRVSRIAKDKRARAVVIHGTREKTHTGLKKTDLIKDRAGTIVSKKASKHSKLLFAHIADWVTGVMKARIVLGVTGFQAVKCGSPLYDKAKEIQWNP